MIPLITPDDHIYVAGHRGMAGSAICRSFDRAGFKQILTATRFTSRFARCLCLELGFRAAAICSGSCCCEVGGIQANSNYAADFLLENLKIQTNVIETPAP